MRFSPVPDAPVMYTKVSFVASSQVLRKSSQNLCNCGQLRLIWNCSVFSSDQLVELGIFQIHNVQFYINILEEWWSMNCSMFEYFSTLQY